MDLKEGEKLLVKIPDECDEGVIDQIYRQFCNFLEVDKNSNKVLFYKGDFEFSKIKTEEKKI